MKQIKHDSLLGTKSLTRAPNRFFLLRMTNYYIVPTPPNKVPNVERNVRWLEQGLKPRYQVHDAHYTTDGHNI